jgi:hypothetical protein
MTQAQDGLTPYLDVVRQLWPEGHARHSPGGRTDGSRTFLVLPDPARTRMLLPSHRVAAARSLLRFSGALEPRERLQRTALSAALRLGGGAALRHRVEVGDPAGSLVETLAERWPFAGPPGELHCSVTLGPARANRKPVMELFDARGGRLGFLKVGLGEGAAGHVRRESANLRELGRATLPVGLRTPTLLDTFEWRGLPVLVMSSLPTSPRQRRLGLADVPREAMRGFARAFAGPSLPLTEMPAWERMTQRRSELAATDHRERLLELLDRLAAAADDVDLETGAWHGDWTPWNMAGGRRGDVALWDFERFETGVPVGLDQCHYVVNEAFYGRAPDPRRAAAALGTLGSDLAPGSPDGLTAAAYVGFVVERYLQAGAVPDRSLGQRIEALLGLGDLLLTGAYEARDG